MDHDDLRTILETSGVDVWTFIDTAIVVASVDYGTELKHRRDGIVERLYATTCMPPRCPNCDTDGPNGNQPKGVSPYTPQFVDRDDDEEEDKEGLDPYGGLFDDEQKNILEIKKQLEDPHQVNFFFCQSSIQFLIFLGCVLFFFFYIDVCATLFVSV